MFLAGHLKCEQVLVYKSELFQLKFLKHEFLRAGSRCTMHTTNLRWVWAAKSSLRYARIRCNKSRVSLVENNTTCLNFFVVSRALPPCLLVPDKQAADPAVEAEDVSCEEAGAERCCGFESGTAESCMENALLEAYW